MNSKTKNDISLRCLEKIIKENPKIISGRKNYKEHHNRILKNIKNIKKFFS